MNKFTLKFEDDLLEKEFFLWSYTRDYFIVKIFLGGLVLAVQFPSIIISIYRSDNQMAMGWGSLMIISIVAFCAIKYRPQSYNLLLSLYHLLIMCVNIYYVFLQNNNIQETYGNHILFVYAAAHGTSHSTIVMLGTNYLMNSLSMMTAYTVYSFTFLDKGFNTFHLFLLFIATFTLFGKYMRDRSQREMFLMRERENKWLKIMKKALPSSIILVQYNEKLDKINLDLVNQNAKNNFKFQNDQSFSEFSRKMQLEKYINFDMTLSNSNAEKFINVDLTNPQNGTISSLQQYINARFRDIAREKKTSQGKVPAVIQNLKIIKNKLNSSDIQDKIEYSNSLSNYSKQITQNHYNYGNQPSNFFPGDNNNIQKNTPKQSFNNKKDRNNNTDDKPSQKLRSQSSSYGNSLKKKKNGHIGSMTQDKNESISIETFIGLYKSSDDQQLKRYKVKVIHYNVGQYYCLIVIEEESDEEKIQFLKKINKSSEQVVQHFIDNVGKHIYRITEQLRDQQLKELIYKKSPNFLRTVKYESSIVYNSIYNIRSHFQWARQKVKVKNDKFPLKIILDDINDTFLGNPKAQDNRVKFFISRNSLSSDNQMKQQLLISDMSLIKQLFYSLIQNSFDNTDKGYIVLKLTEIPGENDLSTIIKVEVSDSGKGFESFIDKVKTLLNVQNPQFSDYYYGSICFGLKNSQKIVRALGPYSKLFIFTRNGKGSRICFYLYQNMNVFQQSNQYVQFQNSLFEEDLKFLKEQYKIEQKIMNEKEKIDEETSFLGFENVTEINIKELEEETENFNNANETKQQTNNQIPYKNSLGDIRFTANSNQFSQSTYQTKNQIFMSPNKKFFSTFSGNLNLHDHEDLGHLNYTAQAIQNNLKNSTQYSASNTQIANKMSMDICEEQRQRNLSLQEDQCNPTKDRATSIFKKINCNDQNSSNQLNNTYQIFSTNNHNTNTGYQSPKSNNLDYSIFLYDRVQEEQKGFSSNQIINAKQNTPSKQEKKNIPISPIFKKKTLKNNNSSINNNQQM